MFQGYYDALSFVSDNHYHGNNAFGISAHAHTNTSAHNNIINYHYQKDNSAHAHINTATIKNEHGN